MKLLRYIVVFAGLALSAAAATRDEIEALLQYLGSLEGASLVRNGETHTPKEAVSHLRMKLEKAGTRVQTAEDFIRLCATRSVVSGKVYLIRFQDGREVESAVVLLKQLDVIRKQAATR